MALLVGLVSQSATAADGHANSGDVVVATIGLIRAQAGMNYADYGVVLSNTSAETDALDVRVRVEGMGARDHAYATDQLVITVIPARASFVAAGSLVSNAATRIVRVKTTVRVGQTLPRGRELPPVSAVTVINGGSDVTASVTNPYSAPISVNGTIYGVFLNRNGRIVASAIQQTDTEIKPGQTAPFDLFGNLSTARKAATVKSAIVTVDPCGPDIFTSACPVPGAYRAGVPG